MTTIAHLSDVHLNGTLERRSRLAQALQRASVADHLVLTGDLTEHGDPKHFVELGAVLGNWPGGAVTLVPGNHDSGNWGAQLQGPLARFARTSAFGAASDFGDVIIVPVDTRRPWRSLAFGATGKVTDEQLQQLRSASQFGESTGRCVVVAMHHGPQGSPLQWFDGLTNREEINQILREYPGTFVVCGHDHRAMDLGQVFSAASCADVDDPLRLYSVIGRRLRPTYCGDRGHYMKGLGWT